MNRAKAYKLVLAALALVLLCGSGFTQRRLNQDRARLGLTRVEPLKNAPPVLAFTTVALGGFRGLIANLLWIRATELQDQGKYFEMAQLADWITKLEPHFVLVWVYQSWNMAYNISVKFTDPHDRWLWVRRGVELLRDDALAYNPREGLIYRELAWFFQHKIGYIMDDAHMYYKQSWAEEMTRALGSGRPDFAALMNPTNADAQARARLLRDTYKLDPQRMKEVDEEYGPLDWRLPDAHAIYWAKLGLEKGRQQDLHFLRRVVYQSMQMSCLRGRVVPNPQGQFELGPNLDLVARANAAYEEMLAAEPESRERIGSGHKFFLSHVVSLFYVFNRRSEAAQWLATLRAKYPDAVAADLDLDRFAVERVSDQLTGASIDRIKGYIDGILTTAFTYLALGENDQAAGHEHLAEQIWQQHQLRFATQLKRVGLPPLPQLKREALDRLLDPEHGLQPQLQAQLRTALNLPAPTQK